MLNKFDQQQFILIQQNINEYESQKPSLDSLMALTQSIEKRLDSLKSIDNTWKEAFRTEWWELEFTSSLMIDNEKENLTKEDEEAVSTALNNMKTMINEALFNQA